ncbi:hypothetical protein ACFQJC_06205 [Haloferax namakaokahaiae]|uniref:N-acetylglutamate synthase n=1 Tax=Haloferax namakaokahaiae TaxID=1748331 RepID=A0ABD5ZD58_9EURY
MTGPRDDDSLDGRVFESISNDSDGDVGGETYFEFDQTGDLVHARYQGGTVRLGHLVGLHLGDSLDFRYTHVTVDGDTATGHSIDRIERLDDGRLRLHEDWAWDSKDGSGTSVLEEVTDLGECPRWIAANTKDDSVFDTFQAD